MSGLVRGDNVQQGARQGMQPHDRVVDVVADELAIIRLMSRLARAQDDRDHVQYRSCFTDIIVIRLPMMGIDSRIAADAWTSEALSMLAAWDVTQHRLFNHIVQVNGDEATCEADYAGIHQLRVSSTVNTLINGGRYLTRLRREEGEWRICERSLDIRYQVGDPSLQDTAFSVAAARRENDRGVDS
jgi:hypothetical protein